MGKKFDKPVELDLRGIVIKGYVEDKIVRYQSNTGSAIYVPKRFEGQKMRVILIPQDATEEINK